MKTIEIFFSNYLTFLIIVFIFFVLFFIIIIFEERLVKVKKLIINIFIKIGKIGKTIINKFE